MIAAVTPERSACPTCGGIFRGRLGHCFQDGTALVPVAGDPLIGRVLKGGRYRLRRALGEGSAGRVYEALDLVTGVSVAVKVLFGELVAMVDVRERFRREAEAAGRLVHPNIASVIDAGLDEPNEPMFLVMPHVVGQTLAERVAAGGPLEPGRVQALLAGLAGALAHAHEHGVLHRDVKPDNVIIEDDTGTPKLIDFGVSKLSIVRANRRLTSYGRVLGTPGFVAPEVLRGEEADERSDLYGLGVTGYFAAVGRLPFSDGEMASVAETLAGIEVGQVDAVAPGGLASDIRRLVALYPGDRPASANDACALLSAPRSRDGLEMDDEDEVAQGLFGPKQRRRMATLAGGATLALVGLVVAWTGVDGAGAVGRPAEIRAAPSNASAAEAKIEVPPGVMSEPRNAPRSEGRVPGAAMVPASASPSPSSPARPPKKMAPAVTKKPAAPRLVRTGRRPAAAKRSPARVGPRRRRRGRRAVRAAATPQDLIRAYSALGRRLQRVVATPGAAPLQQRYFDLPIADALRRRSQVAEVMRKIEALTVDVAALELRGSRP